MDAFDDVRLPIFIERGAKGGPAFSTTIKDLASGKEKRNQNWSRSRGRWDIGYAIDDLDGLRPVLAFFYARRARARGFRFRDWSDYRLERQSIAVADGTKRVFQIVKQYVSGAVVFDRPLTRPVAGTIRVWVDGAKQELLPDGWQNSVNTAGARLMAAAAVTGSPTVFAKLDPATLETIAGTPATPLIGLDGLTLALQDQGSKAGALGLKATQSIADGKRMFEVTTNPSFGANAYGRDTIIVGLGGIDSGITYLDGMLRAEDGSVIQPSPAFDVNAQPLCLGFAVDHEQGQVQIHVNGVQVATTPCVSGRAYRPTVGVVVNAEGGATSARVTANFGASAFAFPIEGFKGVYTGDDPGTPGGGGEPEPDPDPERPMPPAGTVAVDSSTGQVLFGTAPQKGAVIEAACEFDVPVRFDVDELDLELRSGELGTIPSLPIREIKE